jgi:alkylation response protein AidB-like acyl-CoA dehydrogenase
MDFTFSEQAERFRAELRSFIEEHMTAEVSEQVHDTGTVHDWGLHRALAERGWLDRLSLDSDQYAVLVEEIARAGVPADGWGTSELVGHTLQAAGTDAQKRDVVPRIFGGEILVCLGYSEPDAGSDVASVTTRAVPDGDEWVIDGQKMFTTLAHESAYVFLLTRTNAKVPKHRGLTLFLVPMDSAGVETRAIETLGGERTNVTFYTGVRVPDSCRVGAVDGAWDVMKIALAFERQAAAHGDASRMLARAVEWARDTGALADAGARRRLARVALENEVGKLLSWRATWLNGEGGMPVVEGSMAKLWASESFRRTSSDLLDLLGPAGVLQHGEAGAPVDGWVEHAYRHSQVMTIYAGTSEIQRSIIAERGLGLPRSR